MELDTSGFATQGPTLYAGNIGDNKYIIQVSPMGIRLLEGGETERDGTVSHGMFKNTTKQYKRKRSHNVDVFNVRR